ncbi:VCBS repeat-containing protein, partial [Methylorubrum rhodesianum]|uniref:FG-GAP repeat domain-containing protein n=1 Tax=Methylorubrum rhodesianum TaxID=29427 RepID=UPI00190BEDFE
TNDEEARSGPFIVQAVRSPWPGFTPPRRPEIGPPFTDGNSRSDILLQNGQQLAIWQVNGTQFEGGGDVGVMADGWSVSGLADLNGDSKTDILLQNGQALGTWTMNGTQIVSGATVNEQLASGWELA